MRTTITLEPDVAALLKRTQKETHAKPKNIINEALREGLLRMADRDKGRPRKKFATSTVSLGACKFANLDNVSEILSLSEGAGFR